MYPEENRVPKLLGVYNPGTNLKAEPPRFISEDDARRIIRNGEARKCNHGKAIALFRANADVDHLKDKVLPKDRQRGLSLKPTERTMTRALDGSLAASVACSSWAGTVRSFQPRHPS